MRPELSQKAITIKRPAAEQFRAAVQLAPDLAKARVGLAQALLVQGDWSSAAQEFEQAIRLDPRDGGSILRLSQLLATCPDKSLRDGERAVALAERLATATDGKDPLVLQTLADAYAEQGAYDQAILAAQQALKIVGNKNAKFRASLEARLETFRSRWQESTNVGNE